MKPEFSLVILSLLFRFTCLEAVGVERTDPDILEDARLDTVRPRDSPVEM